MDDIVYHLEADKTLRVVLPLDERRKVFNQAHAGTFGGYLREAKIHSQLAKHYWWPWMRSDISTCMVPRMSGVCFSPCW